MAKIIPFRGILYNKNKIKSLSDVITPPFDVISERQQRNFYDRHPQNMIRLVLGRAHASDTDRDNPHTRAAAYLNEWLAENILVRDETPAFYLSAVDFSVAGLPATRYGLIALVGLEPFETGTILPHEKTFSNVKTERFGLMKACHANFSPIFSLFSDDGNILQALKDAATATAAMPDTSEYNGQIHRLWRITDPDVHRYISDTMKNSKLFIADGHHRYETALRYRDWAAHNRSGFQGNHPANFVMMYLSSMQDPGLVILPAHRLLKEVPLIHCVEFIQTAAPFFDIIPIPFTEETVDSARSKLMETLSLNSMNNTFGVCISGHSTFYVLSLKPGVMTDMYGDALPAALRELDVTVLTHLIFVRLLGFDQARLDNEKLIGYTSSEKEAIETVLTGDFDMGFIINPTRIEQVRSISEQRLIMPRKSTYFYPKVITGQVLNLLVP